MKSMWIAGVEITYTTEDEFLKKLLAVQRYLGLT